MNKLFLLITILFSIITHNSFARNAWVDNKEVCEKSRGSWRLFGNSCADNCDSQVDITVCTVNSFYSCGCGEERCWDKNRCVSLKSYKELFEESRKQMKEERKTEEYLNKKEKEERRMRDRINRMQNNVLSQFKKETPANQKEQDSAPAVEKSPALMDIEKLKPDTAAIGEIINQTGNDIKEALCKQNGGTWQQFSNGCADNCSSKIAKFSMCTTALTYGCKCGDNKCWDSMGNKCMLVENYKKIIEQKNQQQNKALQNSQNRQELPTTVNQAVDFLTN